LWLSIVTIILVITTDRTGTIAHTSISSFISMADISTISMGGIIVFTIINFEMMGHGFDTLASPTLFDGVGEECNDRGIMF